MDKIRNVIVSLSLILSATYVKAQSEIPFSSSGMQLVAKRLIKTGEVIWGFEFLPDGNILLTHRKGELKLFSPKDQIVRTIRGLPPVYAQGQGGLLDIRLHPKYKENGWIYVSYSVQDNNDKSSTRLARFRLKNLRINDFQILFTAEPFVQSRIHFGSRILFDAQNFLYLSVGERNERHLAQKLDNHVGKILRLTDTGKPAPENPFPSKQYPRAKAEIWTYGHRNPQGLAIQTKTQKIFEQEHGPQGGDEINILKKGANYGWPIVTFGKEYVTGFSIGEGTSKQGIEQPIQYYAPSIAPCGLEIYEGNHLKPWRGHVFSGALALMHLNHIELNAKNEVIKEERLLVGKGFRIRNVKEGPDEYLYFSTDNGDLYQIKLIQHQRK
ncbi:MAG: PQQ-dependent sugar dehydrogenase [Bdellovibrionales bacterium]|nr:PQQ-dependent sugar dehydrogenase [Bdellovibrionales bacterium]